MGQHTRILVVGPAWIGDMVMAQSLFKTLQHNDPDVKIDVLAPSWSEPLLARMPEIQDTITLPIEHGQLRLATRYSLGKRLRSVRYDQAIIIPRSFKAALLPYFARIPRRTGYRGEMRFGLINDMRPLNKQVLTQTVQRYVALGLESSSALPPSILVPRLQIDENGKGILLKKYTLSTDNPIVGVMPGAEYGPAKRWPTEYYIEVVTQLLAQGCQIWLFGSQNDRQIGSKIVASGNSRVKNLCGKTSLVDVVDLISMTSAVITNDSGLMHVAAAAGVPLVAIYGSSSPGYTPPLTDRAEVIYLNVECSPCFERSCPYGHTKCLYEVKPEEVIDKIGILMNEVH